MNLREYQRQKAKREREVPKYRNLCVRCVQPEFSCYCAHIQSFDPKLQFVILIHPIEMKRRIATGRMSHLCLQGSRMIVGQDYTLNKEVNEIIADPAVHPMVLYPGVNSLNLTHQSQEKRNEAFSGAKKPVIFVVDGTWATARKTMHLSQNLKSLPRICFTPPGKSLFRVRKQPGVDCYSTIEAIHHVLELLGDRPGYEAARGEHAQLLHVFNKMVDRQIEFVRDAFENPRPGAYRRPRNLSL